MNRVALVESICKDIRYAFRTLHNRPVLVITAVLTLALAIGANTAIFTVIRAVLLKPLTYPGSDRLVSLTGGATPTRFAEMRAAAHSFTGLAAYYGPENVTLSGGAEPEVLKAARVSAGFLRVAGLEPALGRGFRPGEDSPAGAPVAMISFDLWQRHFNSDPQITGKTVTLASAACTIIGVLPPRFQFPLPGLDIWLTQPSEEPLIDARSRVMSPYLTLVGRLKPGVSIEQADAEARVLRHQYALAHPAMLDGKPRPVEVNPLKQTLVSSVRTTLWTLFGAVALVLLIACANLAGLLLARATSRTREFAVRSALGAASSRLICQLLAESVLLSLAGGTLGFLLASWSLGAIGRIDAFQLPRAGEIHLDWTVLAFTSMLSIATGVIFGLAPSLVASRPDLMATLRASGDLAAARRLPALNVRGLLVIAQIALSIVLLIGAALLVETIANLRHLDLGFNPSNLLTMRISLPPLRYDTEQKRATFFDTLVQQSEASPGVLSAAAAWSLPMTGYPGTPVQDASQPPLRLNQRPIEVIISVTPGYFRTLAIPLKRGRDFNSHDTADSQRVTIIDEGLARQFWPGYPNSQEVLGKRIFIGGINPNPAQIIGVVADVREALPANAWPGTVYVPFSQQAPQAGLFVIRTPGDPLHFTTTVRSAARALDPDQSISNVQTMDTLIDTQVGQRRLLMILLESFAAVALLLALIGIYGVLAYSVSQRTQELGIRRALGATPSDILWLIIRQALFLMLAGITFGFGGAYVLTRVAASVLFHVSPTDPATFLGIAGVFLLVALAAAFIPALRAARIDPMAALRI